ncbi:MAG: glutamine synthetase III [Lewinellaceae bacterium]|nr:glutamine synthetase III [Saprospiraceae bacterium]MCB9337815.1 glutamine synthetase III [Lewinellaceae bacterium]
MSIRLQALEKIQSNGKGVLAKEQKKISEIFGKNVFNVIKMQEYLPEKALEAVIHARKTGEIISLETAETVAKGMKKWAMDFGATHYTHWFQPLTGLTAEKHDAFYKPAYSADAMGIESLSARDLVQREPDASSFPSGGLRNTAEARGYTIWDPTSPAFILELESGKTLYVPAIFISYTGEALDYKAPLLKSIEAVNRAVTPVAQYFHPNAQSVIATLGWEQEYFIVDENLYEARPDLSMVSRTLFGILPAKGQEKADHYFGSIPERVQRFMHDFEQEALRLGIPVLTRHNEVAPAQYECAPMFEELNTAVDHNLLLMDVMQRIAKRHHLRVLFHEKPFAGINGSGKHNNWSLATDTGINLLSPGDEPARNLRFLTFFTNIIRAVERYSDLMRASVASSGNDHRMGANEAPPAIISVFTGSLMEQILHHFKDHGFNNGKDFTAPTLELNVPKIPEVLLDNTDRNRTSPFPFTGNKFEYRAVGASHNCSFAMTVLNTIVADQFHDFHVDVESLIKKGHSQEAAIVQVLQQCIKDSEHIIFNGDGYSAEWEEEAARRGLANIKSTPYALDCFLTEKARHLFSKHFVLNERELDARVSAFLDYFIKDVEMEAVSYQEVISTHVLPSAINYLNRLANAARGLKEMDLEESANSIRALAKEIGAAIEKARKGLQDMHHAKEAAEHETDLVARAKRFQDELRPTFTALRDAANTLESLIDDAEWRLPHYRELLFMR